MRIAIVGVGSLGTIIGALITKAGVEIDLIDKDIEQVRALRENGARVTGQMNLTTPVKAFTPDEIIGKYDLILYLVKATHDHEALPFIYDHLEEDGFVLTMQNGMPEERIAKFIGPERIMGCAVGWGATLVRPGISRMTSEVHRMTYDVGEIDGSDSERLQRVIDLLSLAGQAYKTFNLIGLRWSKLLFNAPFNGTSTIIGGTYGDVLLNHKALLCAAHIMREALIVARAANIHLQVIQEFNFNVFNFNNKKELIERLPLYGIFYGPHRDIKASMLYDIEKGEPCEIDAINGVISAWARKYRVETPVNDQVVETIKAIENGSIKPGPAVFNQITIPVLPEE